MAVIAAAISGIGLTAFSLQFKSVNLGWRHLVSGWDCDAAYMVGMAPARRGKPGYWDSHDVDKDGVSCELIPDRGWEARYIWL